MTDWGIPETLPRRFWEKVNKKEDNECWEWTASKHWAGYGMILLEDRKQIKAHRASWLLHNGTIPKEAHVLHHCDNPGCVNPRHLYLGNHKDNMKDMVERGRSATGRRHSSAKLDEVKVAEIRFLCSRGISQRKAARWYGVSQATVWSLIHRRTWKHVW